MTTKEFYKFISELDARGYHKYPPLSNADYTYFKSFGKSKHEEDRSNYQIAFSVYDWRKYIAKHERLAERPYSIDTKILVSRVVDESLDLGISNTQSDNPNIADVEALAEKFFEWVENNVTIDK